ncbi:hypothetical protein L1887_53584 [Cichorium endivia]|nr:hypothetical protein L1887_53584 [Cichorium endivia]
MLGYISNNGGEGVGGISGPPLCRQSRNFVRMSRIHRTDGGIFARFSTLSAARSSDLIRPSPLHMTILSARSIASGQPTIQRNLRRLRHDHLLSLSPGTEVGAHTQSGDSFGGCLHPFDSKLNLRPHIDMARH